MRSSLFLARIGLACTLGVLCTHALAQEPPRQPDKPDEKFEETDPYTRGAKKDLEHAGYESLGPFHLADDIQTQDVEETLGTRILWVETAHFHLGSTLPAYDCPSDDIEQEQLKGEFTRLGKRIPRARRPPRKLDPWLRLHLYAQRLEELYSDFEQMFALQESEFGPSAAAGKSLGAGRYLGMELKFTVLLTAKTSSIARFGKQWLGLEEQGFYRARLPGGSWYFGTSAETLRKLGCESDAGLHALVAYGVAVDLCDAFGGGGQMKPLWWKHGLGLYESRRADERWSVHVERTATGSEADAWRWEPRIRGLLENDFLPTWEAMLGWPYDHELDAGEHMSTWSRVEWLMTQEKTDRRAFLVAISTPLENSLDGKELAAAELARATQALAAGFGKSPAELDAAWRKFVLRKYPKR
ncbi:MAG: hypothetical protein IPJ19_20185 [Planctomycetes bacterium]|nr:hypothetical protein [Planctomycetota bacterium]